MISGINHLLGHDYIYERFLIGMNSIKFTLALEITHPHDLNFKKE